MPQGMVTHPYTNWSVLIGLRGLLLLKRLEDRKKTDQSGNPGQGLGVGGGEALEGSGG